MKNGKQLFSFLAIHLILVSTPALASEAGIGFYTAVSGRVTVEHSGEAQVFPVKLNDQVWFKDVIETSNESRTKAFFEDDSVLTVGHNSRVEINEYVYQPEHNTRRAIVKLMQGQVRALVSKIFKANGSKFEVHTPSAVAAARGTYFTVWVENGQSGIINIGENGRVDFTSGGKTVTVDPGFFSIAQEGSAPSVPMPHHIGVDNDKSPTSPSSGLGQAVAAVEATTLRDAPINELPVETLRALNVDGLLVEALGTMTGLPADSLSSTGGTTAITTGTLTTGTVTAGSVSVGTVTALGGGTLSVGSVSVGSVSVGSLSVGSTTLTPVTSTVVAPLTPVVSPVVSTVGTTLTPILK